MDKTWEIVDIDSGNHEQLAHLFFEFWPDETSLKKELDAAKEVLSNEKHQAYLVKVKEQYVGFIQLSIRYEYVDGKTSPFVGYIEGIYLQKAYQKKGIGKALIHKGEEWARANGCSQVGSDTGIENTNSIAFHEHLGYKLIHHYVSFMKDL